MNLIHNKHGPDFDVGFPSTRRSRDGPDRRTRDGPDRRPRDGPETRPRDGPERRPRDGPERKPRDGPERKPHDGTERRPRDKPILWKDSLVIRYFYRHTDQPQDVRIHGRPSSKWRKPWWGKPALWTGMGEACPEENEK
jgi:hypothetical protein